MAEDHPGHAAEGRPAHMHAFCAFAERACYFGPVRKETRWRGRTGLCSQTHEEKVMSCSDDEGRSEQAETQEVINDFQAEMERSRAVTDRLIAETDVLKRDHEAHLAAMRAETEEMKARTERLILMNCKKQYRDEIHGVAINVLVGVLTKDAIRSIKDGDFSTTSSKIDIGQLVDYSLIVGKRYVDELHKINVSDKQLAEYKDSLGPIAASPSLPEPLITPPPKPSSES
jgi:hypothetical protein